MFYPPCSVMWRSPSLCQSVVTEVKYKLVEGVRLDLSHFLFLLFHDLHGGFLQGGAGRCRQLASARHSSVAFRQACESLSSALIPFLFWFGFFPVCLQNPLQPDLFVHVLPKNKKTKWNEMRQSHSTSTGMRMRFVLSCPGGRWQGQDESS